MRQHPLRIFYAAGPGDVVSTFRHWKSGRDDPSQVAITYSSQFFETCRELGAEGCVVAWHPRRDTETGGSIHVEHHPVPLPQARGVLYHLRQIWRAAWLTVRVRRFGADLAVISEGAAHWFALILLPLCGVKVVPTLHCVMYPKYGRIGRAAAIIRWLDGRWFRHIPLAVLSLSHDITAQVEQVTGGAHPPIIPFVPTYRREPLAAIADPPANGPFRVFFAGRIETNKGVYDLLEIAARFAREGRNIEFDLAGAGSQLEPLRQQATQRALQDRFRCHGHCDKRRMDELFGRCHAVIVPTRSDFVEGFNKVVLESVLAGRPVITSAVCPALEYVRDAAIEVQPDDVDGYARAVIDLAENADLYESKQRAARQTGETFFDAACGWGAAFRQAVEMCRPAHQRVAAAREATLT